MFKYFSEGILEHVFVRDDHIGIKCSLPQDYNDPFELFLGIDLDQGPELLATYSEVVYEIPSLLTTCFSKSPVVAPMWAHYGNNHRGFVIGLDVAQTKKIFPDIFIDDVSYRSVPSKGLANFTAMAAYRCKPRDAMFLRDAVKYQGYFSKYLEWSYEQEVRAVSLESYVENVGENKILYVPKSCISAVISGANSSPETIKTLQDAAAKLNAKFYSEKIGRSYPTPYLIDDTQRSNVFTKGAISVPKGVCKKCSEPLKKKGESCPWCSIDGAHKIAAAAKNPLRLLNHYGLLERYVDEFSNISAKTNS